MMVTHTSSVSLQPRVKDQSAWLYAIPRQFQVKGSQLVSMINLRPKSRGATYKAGNAVSTQAMIKVFFHMKRMYTP